MDPNKPFEFDFHVSGDLSDPKFDLWQETRNAVQKSVANQITEKLKMATADKREKAEETLDKFKEGFMSLKSNLKK
jgi:ABC-type Zn2+ transport system substrate-binding protein/surface adhesin